MPSADNHTLVKPMQLPPPPRSRFQFSLRIILLVTAVVAVWTAEIVNRREIPFLQRRIAAMRPIARELSIKDPAKIAVVKCEELWYDENEWDVYLPEGKFELKVATQEIDDRNQPAEYKSVFLPSGQFRLAITQQKTDTGWRVSVTKDDQEILTADEPPEWYPASGSSGGGNFSVSETLEETTPVVLFRRRFTRPLNKTSNQVPKDPCEGVLLWIEAAP